MADKLKDILARNAAELAKKRYGKWNQTQLRADSKVGMSALTAIKDGEYKGLEVLEKVAAALKADVWQLLHPQGTRAAPALSPMAADLAELFDRLESQAVRQKFFAQIEGALIAQQTGESVEHELPIETSTPHAAEPTPSPRRSRQKQI